MDYFSPERQEGRIIGASVVLPELHIMPENAETLFVRLWLPSEGFKRMSFSQRDCLVRVSEIESFMRAWIEDPEKVLAERFGWRAKEEEPDVMKMLFGEE